jgi:hypothetical protein
MGKNSHQDGGMGQWLAAKAIQLCFTLQAFLRVLEETGNKNKAKPGHRN